MSFLDVILAFLARLFKLNNPPATPTDEPLQVVSPRVLVINFDPIVDGQGTRLTAKMGWNNVDDLIKGFIADIDEVSYGLVKYQYSSANRIDVNEFPLKSDHSFQYTAASYLAVMQDEKTHYEPDGVDYWKIVNDYHLIERVMSNQIDEVWLFGGPYFGFWESHMVGKNAIWCNSSPLVNSDQCTRRFVIMGFNYQRGVAEMIHDIGHRMESIMAYVYDSFEPLQNAFKAVNPAIQPPVSPAQFLHPKNDFERFMLFEKIAPGRAEIGLVHTPPNADKDYDWQNPATVSSGCDDWLNYPDFQGTRRMLNCNEWGCGGDGYAYTKWWFKHVPHAKGGKNGILNNWWKYTMQVDQPFRS
ncbi:MAG TPA: hypothetical protein VMS73_04915 [Anaerolineaceae bacterium]|nr:hypothetical protein [Anaerolineaceae bacterium]